MYNLFYYFGSSFFEWFCGLVFVAHGWAALVAMVVAMIVFAGAVAVVQWRIDPTEG